MFCSQQRRRLELPLSISSVLGACASSDTRPPPFPQTLSTTYPSSQPIFPHSSHPVSTRPYRRFNAAAIRRRLHLIQSLRRGTGLRLPACLLAGRLLSIWPKLSSRPIVHLSCNVGIAQRHIRSLEACCRYFTNFTHIFFPWNRRDTLLLVSFQVFRPHHQAPPPSYSTKEILTCKGREPRFVFPAPLQGGGYRCHVRRSRVYHLPSSPHRRQWPITVKTGDRR